VNWLDIFFCFLVVIFMIEGLAQGFSRAVVGLVALVAGLVIAAWTYGVAASFLLPYVSSKSVANVLGFIFIFVVIQILGGIAGKILQKLFKWTGLGWLDRLLGGAFGGLKAVLFGIVLVLVLTAFPLKPIPHTIAHSRVAPYLIDAAHAITFIAPRELRDGFAETYDRIRELWDKGVRHLPQEHSEAERSEKKRLDTDKY